MNLKKAVNRLSYTIGNQNKCNTTDVEAFNVLIDWINDQDMSKRLHYNHHFCKMVMFIYNDLLIHYKGDNLVVEKEIQKALEEPLNLSYKRFKMIMDTFSLNTFFDHVRAKNSNFNQTHTLDELREEYKKRVDIFSKPETAELFKEHLSMGMYTQEEINNKLNTFLSLLLNNYENKEHDLHFLQEIITKNNESTNTKD